MMNFVTYNSSVCSFFPPLLPPFIHQQRKEEKLKQYAGVDLVKTNIDCHINEGKPLSLSSLFLHLLKLCCFHAPFLQILSHVCLPFLFHSWKTLISEIWGKITDWLTANYFPAPFKKRMGDRNARGTLPLTQWLEINEIVDDNISTFLYFYKTH